MGRGLAKSAASSSFASEFTADLHSSKGTGLGQAQFAPAGQFEQGEKAREDLPGFGAGRHDVTEARHGAQRDDGAHDLDEALARRSGVK